MHQNKTIKLAVVLEFGTYFIIVSPYKICHCRRSYEILLHRCQVWEKIKCQIFPF